MLLNEFLKKHRKVEQLEKQIEALTAGLQKVTRTSRVEQTNSSNSFERPVASAFKNI